MKGIPQFVVHGDADNTVNVSGSRNMVAALKKAGADVTYIEVRRRQPHRHGGAEPAAGVRVHGASEERRRDDTKQ